jgi:REP element-mobilizing transposase RayT
MIIAHHLIWTAYGWWLPNDPRGSTSREIRVERIEPLGDLHYGRKPIQPAGREIGSFYQEASNLLKHPLLTLDEHDVEIVAQSFRDTIKSRGYTCFACAIMPDHIHLLIRRHRDKGDQMISHFQSASAVKLIGQGRRPADHPVWGGPGWKVFLRERRDVIRTVAYIRRNPLKIRLASQEWPFVTPYDGWLPGGHPEAAVRVAKPRAKRGEPA